MSNSTIPVREEMYALLTKKTEEKDQKAKEKQMDRDGIDLDHSEDESCGEENSDHRNQVLVLKQKPAKGSNSTVVGGSTIDNFFKPPSVEESVQMMRKGISLKNKVQTSLTTQKREERRDRAYEYICQFFYEASIPHNTVTLPSFDHMLEAIGEFGV